MVENIIKTEHSKEKTKDWRVLEFIAPIKESAFDNNSNEFKIRGVAINETTTLNNIKYVADELEKAAESFRNVPILLDHKNEVMNIVGRTTENVNFNHTDRRIDFEARIMDKEVIERIKDGRIQSVSIGAKVNDLLEEEDGSKKAVGIKGLEISMVGVAGDQRAGLAQAIEDSFVLKEKAMLSEDGDEDGDEKEIQKESVDINIIKKDITDIKDAIEKLADNSSLEQGDELNHKKEENMSEEDKKQEEVPEVKEEEAKEEPKEESAEESAKESATVTEMRKEIDTMKELIATKKKLNEEAKELESKEPEDETKGEVGEEKEEEKSEENTSDFVVEDTSLGMSFYRPRK